MLWLLIAPLWIALLIGLIWVFLRAKNTAARYEAIYEPGHLIEFGKAVRRIRAEALEAVGSVSDPGFEAKVTAEYPELPPGAARTGAGLILFYRVDREDEVWRHHFSIFCEGGFFAQSTGRFLFAYLHHLMGLEVVEVSLGLSDNGRYHLTWQLDDAAQSEFVQREVPVPAEDELQGVLEQCWSAASQVRIGRVTLPT